MFTPIPTEVREKVKQARQDHPGWTQKRLGQEFGISEAAVRKILGKGV